MPKSPEKTAIAAASGASRRGLFSRWRSNPLRPDGAAPSRRTSIHLPPRTNKRRPAWSRSSSSSAYVPLEPRHLLQEPQDTISRMMEDSSVHDDENDENFHQQQELTSPSASFDQDDEGQQQDNTRLLETPTQSQIPLTELEQVITPPACLPPPLVVSAKKLGLEVRRNHSLLRRARSYSSSSTSSGDDAAMEDVDTWGQSALQEQDPEKQRQEYWILCYGHEATPPPTASWSAKRAPPSKSCLSSKKRSPACRTPTSQLSLPGFSSLVGSISSSPTAALSCSSVGSVRSRTRSITPRNVDSFLSQGDSSSTLTGSSTPGDETRSKHVQFGNSMAAEYVVEEAPNSLHKLSDEEASTRFPVDEREDNEDDEVDDDSTELNNSILRQWESFEPEEDTSFTLSQPWEEENSDEGGHDSTRGWLLWGGGDDEARGGSSQMASGSRSRRRDSIYSPTPSCLLLPDPESEDPQAPLAGTESPRRQEDGDASPP